MGCDILALELVKNWEFLEKSQPHVDVLGQGYRNRQRKDSGGSVRRVDLIDSHSIRRGIHRRRSSVTISDLHDVMAGLKVGGDGGVVDRQATKIDEDSNLHLKPTPLGLGTGTGMNTGGGLGGGTGSGKQFVKPPASVFQEPDMSWAFG